MQKWQKWTLAGVVVTGLAIGASTQEEPRTSGPSDFSVDIYIKVVQQEYPSMSGAEAVLLGGTACDAFDTGGDRMAALRAVATEDGRTERARYIVDAATTELCPEYR